MGRGRADRAKDPRNRERRVAPGRRGEGGSRGPAAVEGAEGGWRVQTIPSRFLRDGRRETEREGKIGRLDRKGEVLYSDHSKDPAQQVG